MPDQLPTKIEELIRNISDEELEFRGWTRAGVGAEYAQRIKDDERSPQVGDLAPDFELERLAATGERTGEFLKLASLRGKPVGLIFGSYT